MTNGSMACLLALAAVGCGRVAFEPRSDAGVDVPMLEPDECSLALESDDVALYGFEDADLGVDATGGHSGTLRGTVTSTAGRCGAAATFSSSYVLVPDDDELDLMTGSVELFVRVPEPDTGLKQTLFARDAQGSAQDGHFMLMLLPQGDVLARIQRAGGNYFRCAPPLTANTWTHVAVSFGGTAAEGFRLWIDHVEATQPMTRFNSITVSCTEPVPPGGINGNNNAFLLGAGNGLALEGAVDPTPVEFLFGDLDEVRIRSTWRDFGR